MFDEYEPFDSDYFLKFLVIVGIAILCWTFLILLPAAMLEAKLRDDERIQNEKT